MGHHQKSINVSCDIMWKQMILHTLVCFVSHYTNAFFFLNKWRFFSHPLNLKTNSTCTKTAVPYKWSLTHMYFKVNPVFICMFVGKFHHPVTENLQKFHMVGLRRPKIYRMRCLGDITCITCIAMSLQWEISISVVRNCSTVNNPCAFTED